MAAAAMLHRLASRSGFIPAKHVLSAACRRHSTATADLIDHMDKKETWDRFYQQAAPDTPPLSPSPSLSPSLPRPLEWFFGFPDVSKLLLATLGAEGPPARVLDLGCGTSDLGPSLLASSSRPVDVACVDFSPVAVALLRNRLTQCPPQPRHPESCLEVLKLDCTTDLLGHFGSGSLDLVLDKATTDALLRSPGRVAAGQALRQCLGVLRPAGALLQFSDEDPDARLPWLERESRAGGGDTAARVSLQELGMLRGVCYYCYIVSPAPSSPEPPKTEAQEP
ncbi:citrate synthase-lysine N-methyltransferase CSKMT, mitochondrial [Amia ocellicauda]|uniref:citrate synthase-lysine N-methyltransferase CSKMT, mitochondrial n=1 Tax=Amia ocellicauda TaxID=2972642 RepID=UPI003464A1E3